jgi:hypothetical protein
MRSTVITTALSLLAAALFAPLANAADAPPAQQAAITADDGREGDLLGIHVAIDGDTMVLGSLHGVAGSAPGTAYVFQRPAGAGWGAARRVAELTLTAPAGGEVSSVAISGDTIAVGDKFHTVGTHQSEGAVAVYVEPPAGWHDAQETAVLTASDGAASDELGADVAIDGDTIVAGSLHRNVGGADRAAAYVFVKPAGSWFNITQTARLTPSDGATRPFQSGAVGISGDTVVVGDGNRLLGAAQRAGDVNVYTKPAAGWADEHESVELAATEAAADDVFGSSVAISGDTVAAGAPGRRVDGVQTGAAFVFVKPATGWHAAGGLIRGAELTASDGAAAASLGEDVSVSGDTVVAGAPFHKVGGSKSQGAAYVFTKPAPGWTDAAETAELTASDGTAGDRLGTEVGSSGSEILAGAPFRPIGSETERGAAYLFAAPPAVNVASPPAGAHVLQGRRVAARYSCTAPAGASITACAGPVPVGSAIDTRTPGPHTFAVRATDSDGVSAAQTVRYTVVRRLAISGFRQSARAWRRHTTFSFRLSKRAKVALRFTRRVHGRTVSAGVLRRGSHAGRNRIRFGGHVSRGHRLSPGRYAVRLVATAAGEHARSRQLRFKIAG